MIDPYGNSWFVNVADKTGNRPDGKPFNEDFRSIKDFDEDECVARVVSTGGSAEDGRLEWKVQWAACSEDEQEAYEIFYLSVLKHQCALLSTRRQREDAQLARRKSMEEERRALRLDESRVADGETAEDRLEASLRLAAQVAAPRLVPGGQLASFSPDTITGIKQSGNVGNMKLYQTVDGLEVWTDVKSASAIIGPNLSLYRTCEGPKLRRQMDHSGIGWSMESALQALDEDRQRLESKSQIVPSDPLFALAFWSEVEGNPGFVDRRRLEALLRMQFRSTDHGALHYLMFYPYGRSEIKIFDKMTHLASLSAIQKIWWIFLGNAWRFCLQPLIDRLTDGDLAHLFRVVANLPQLRNVHHLLTYQVQSAFCLVGSAVRRNEPRLRQTSAQRSIDVLVREVQGFFEDVVTPGNNAESTASRLLEFSASGTLAAAEATLEKLNVGTPTKVALEKKDGDSDGSGNRHPRDDEDDAIPAENYEPQKKKPKKDEGVCLRNIILQWFGDDMDSIGDMCSEECAFKHIPVSNIKRSSFEKALQAGPALFGETFVNDSWADKLSEAYGSSGGLRKRAVYSLYGVPF